MSLDKLDGTHKAASNRQPRDSDSGHGPTSSSASNSSDADESDCFEDALEAGQTCCTSQTSPSPPLSEHLQHLKLVDGGDADGGSSSDLRVCLEETAVILRMALNNEFARALELCSRRAERELYAGLASATLSFLRAALTLEQTDLQAALDSINLSFQVSGRMRRKANAASMVMRLIYRPNYNAYTDHEIHAELVHAESLLLLALISFLADQSIICLVKGAFRIRTCYQRYKECLYIMESRTEWKSELAKRHFESGVRMGYGIFNLLMSYLPRRVLRFLEYVGFSGNRSVGVDELDKSVKLDDGLRSVFSTLVILTYHTYIENLFGLGSYEEERVEELNGLLQQNYPTSAFYLLFRGRYHQMRGELGEAIDTFERCIGAQDDWKQFHSICHWEIMWCHAVQMDWQRAAHYSDLLRHNSKWSAASYTYQYATFLYAQLVEDERANRCSQAEYSLRLAEIRQVMERVPVLRIRYAGKTIPAEKFAIMRSMKFCQQNNRLTLPALEFLYIWNVFVTMRNSPQQVERLMQRIESELTHIESKLSAELKAAKQSPEEEDDDDDETENSDKSQLYDHWQDDLCLALLLKGMCLKQLDRLEEAERCFMRIMDAETLIKTDTFLAPHTAMELGLLKLGQKLYQDAKHWVKLARNNYTGYLLETIVHFRLHAANRLLRMEQQGDELGSSSESAATMPTTAVSAAANNCEGSASVIKAA